MYLYMLLTISLTGREMDTCKWKVLENLKEKNVNRHQHH